MRREREIWREDERFREKLFLQREEEEGEEKRSCYSVVLSFSGQHVFQFGDATSLSLPSRAGKSSTANR